MKRLAITLGDAAGVGPEILLRTAAAGELGEDVVVYGEASVLRRGQDLLGLRVSLRVITEPEEAVVGLLNVVDLGLLGAEEFTPGVGARAPAAAARAAVLRACTDALAGRNAGLVTLPMNKEATRLSDPRFCGHTELIAEACGCERYSMMLATPKVACSHVSAHCSMQAAIARCTQARVLEVIQLTHEALARFIERPRIAVCGLNPHAGEQGLFGEEDAREIAPAVAAAQAAGLQVTGPLPGDTVFYRAVEQRHFDGIVCQYHDQGHAPMKLIAFEVGVNVTIGLPIVRTSVDHGTAYDIAWQGQAFTKSLQHALRYARQLAWGVQEHS